MIRILTISTFCLLLVSCKVETKQSLRYSKQISAYFGNPEIKNSGCEIKTTSNYWAYIKIYQYKMNAKRLVRIVENLNWEVDNTLTSTKENGDWIQFAGSIQSVGMSLSYSESGQKFASNESVFTIEEIALCLLSFVASDDAFKKRYQFVETD